MNFTQINLERRRVATSLAVTRHAKLDVSDDILHDQLIYRLESYVMANQIDSIDQMRAELVPATWWQHFKADAIKWGNPFFSADKIKTRRIEVRVRYRAWATFPDCPVEFPPGLGPVRIAVDAEVLDPDEW